mmetsp:Transcript_37700/g.84282  ORF Transcript_37700/g.84282 Transcript_37700/m.84282 type:complete len:111 (-) Transcript_37700:391-723(-)
MHYAKALCRIDPAAEELDVALTRALQISPQSGLTAAQCIAIAPVCGAEEASVSAALSQPEAEPKFLSAWAGQSVCEHTHDEPRRVTHSDGAQFTATSCGHWRWGSSRQGK